eukprot:3555843-Pyramimonas_sp.AAC.1
MFIPAGLASATHSAAPRHAMTGARRGARKALLWAGPCPRSGLVGSGSLAIASEWFSLPSHA